MMIRDHRSLRLVVLNACEGARSARDDPFRGVAQALVRQGIPAVIAMQFEISDPAALVFSQSFYQAIADGLPVDVATVEARRAMFADGNEVEWATPVLYLRSPDGRVFVRSHTSEADRQAREDAETAGPGGRRTGRPGGGAERQAREEAETAGPGGSRAASPGGGRAAQAPEEQARKAREEQARKGRAAGPGRGRAEAREGGRAAGPGGHRAAGLGTS